MVANAARDEVNKMDGAIAHRAEAPATSGPGQLVELDRDACLRKLGDRGIGRVAVSINALPAILPVNYAMLDGDVVFRTGPGTKLDAAATGAVVAFEIDEADPLSHTGWSVLVIGVARPITDDQLRARAAHLPLTPWAAGDRDTFVRLDTMLVSGRELTYAGVATEPLPEWSEAR